MRTFYYFIKSMRMKQWIKNCFIFAPTIFALQFFEAEKLTANLLAFILFSLVTGSVYIFNDVVDKPSDVFHPVKKLRPIARGQLSIFQALFGATIVLITALILIFSFFNYKFFIIVIIYITLNLCYTLILKRVVIMDVMIIAIGFVLRVEIGGVITGINLSVWILIITFLLAIFLALIKRMQELKSVPLNNGEFKSRSILHNYNLDLLNQLISITTATTLISYIIYITNTEIQLKFGTNKLYLTVPFVIFGIFRYLYLTYVKNLGENPAEVFFSDFPFFLNIFLWGISFILILIFR